MSDKPKKIPAGVKVPQDRKPKDDDASSGSFQFTHKGQAFTSPPLINTLSPGFLRRNRDKADVDFYFTILESLFDDQPEVAIIFSWHIADELAPKLRAKGYRGKLVTPLPVPREL